MSTHDAGSLTIDQDEWRTMKKAERKEIEPPTSIQEEEIEDEQEETTIEGTGYDDKKRKQNIPEGGKR